PCALARATDKSRQLQTQTGSRELRHHEKRSSATPPQGSVTTRPTFLYSVLSSAHASRSSRFCRRDCSFNVSSLLVVRYPLSCLTFATSAPLRETFFHRLSL